MVGHNLNNYLMDKDSSNITITIPTRDWERRQGYIESLYRIIDLICHGSGSRAPFGPLLWPYPPPPEGV